MKNLIKKLLRKGLLNENYFNPTLPNDVKKLSHKYEGKNVVWYGHPEQMIVIHKDDVRGMWGNIYYQDKMDYLVNLIQTHEDKIEIECSYGLGDIVTLTDIIEEQRSYIGGSFGIDFEGRNEPSSTGDRDLDTYLGTEDLSDFEEIAYYTYNDELIELFNDNALFISSGKVSIDELKKDFERITDGSEGDIEALDQFLKYEAMVKEAKEEQTGDLGKFKVQIRDGHHRVFAAIKAGEEYICLNLVKKDIERFKGHYTKV